MTVGARELKAKLSYYLQLMQAGQEIAITVHHRIVGYLSKFQNPGPSKKPPKTGLKNKRKLMMLKEKWAKEGFLLSPGDYKYRSLKPVHLKKGPSTTEIINSLRDETL